MAKKMKNCGYKKGHKAQNRNITIMADDIYAADEVENLNQENTFPLLIRLPEETAKTEINGNLYYLFSTLIGPVALLDIQKFLDENRKMIFLYHGTRRISRIYGQRYDEDISDIIIHLQEEDIMFSDLISNIMVNNIDPLILTKKSNDC